MAFGKKGGSKADRDQEKADRAAEREARRKARREARGKDRDQADSGGGGSGQQVSMTGNRRKDERVIRETVFETAGSIMRKNKPFAVKRDGEDLYVGAYLKFSDIGGLSKKDMKDESKGSIINLINNGRIQNIYDSELAEEEAIVFIPDKDTVWHMDEYALLSEDVQYELVLVSLSDETIEHTGVEVNLAYLKKCHETGQNIRVKLGSVLEDATLDAGRMAVPGPDGPAGSGSRGGYAYEPEPEPESEVGYGGPVSGGYVIEQGEPESGYIGDSGDEHDGGQDFGDGYDPDEPVNDGEEDGESDETEDAAADGGTYGSGPSEEQDTYVDQEQASRALRRKFFGGGLERELDSSALDQALEAFAYPVEIELRDEGSWLGDQVNAFIVHANAQLEDLHARNMAVVQQEYLNTVGRAYSERLAEAVSGLESDPRYADLQAKSKAVEATIPDRVKAEKEKLAADWENRVRSAGESARVSAEQAYKDRYGYQHDERMKNVEADIRAGMMSAINKKIADLKAVREAEAKAALDGIDSDAIEAATAHYAELHEAETALAKEFTAAIRQVLDEKAADEMVRVRVLEDELARDRQLEALQKEYADRAKALQADFDARVSAISADLEMARKRHAADLADKDAEIKAVREKAQEEKAELREHVKSLMTDVERVTQSKKTEVEVRTGELKAEKDALQQHYDQLASSHRRTDMAIIGVAVLASLVLFFVGFLLGGRGGDRSQGAQKPAVTDVADPAGQDVPDTGEGPQTGQEGVTGQDSDGTGQPGQDSGTGQDGPSPEDQQWVAMQDPVISVPKS